MKPSRVKSKHFLILREQAESLIANAPKKTLEEGQNVYELLHELSVHQFELEMQNEQLRLAQSELESSRNQYIDLYEFAPISYFTLNADYTILTVNFAGADLLVVERLSLYQKNFANFVTRNSLPVFYKHIELLNSGFKQTCELELKKKNGAHCYVRMESILSQNKQIRVSIMDITISKQTEVKLIEANKLLCFVNNLFQSTSDAVAALTKELKFIQFNQAFQQAFFTQYHVKIDTEMNIINIFAESPMQQTAIVTACQRALAGEVVILTNEFTDVNSHYHYYETRFTPVMDEYAQCIGLNYLIRDVTQYRLNERKTHKHQAKMAHIDRVNTIGEMAAALAHEINQPLMAISAYAAGCICRLEKNMLETQQLMDVLQRVTLQAEHAGTVIHRMKNFMHNDKMYYERVNINEVISETLNFLGYEFSDIPLEIKFELAADLPAVLVDKVQIAQVISNLVRNSIEAIQGASIMKPILTIRTGLEKNDIIAIHVVDNGPGIPSKIINKILNTYFTTKPQGTGLGLAICQTLIGAHGGKLSVKPNPTGGAWVQFTLPVHQQEVYADVNT